MEIQSRFIGCNLFFLPIVFFFFPEVGSPIFLLGGHTDKMQTKGLTLEEVNRAFGDKVEMEMSVRNKP